MSIASSQPQVRFSHHCVLRYVERLRPGTDQAAAKRDLACMHQTMTFSLPPPAWLDGCLRHDADAYLILGADIAFILRHSPTDSTSWCAVTVLVRGMPSEATRERRAARKCSRGTGRSRSQPGRRALALGGAS